MLLSLSSSVHIPPLLTTVAALLLSLHSSTVTAAQHDANSLSARFGKMPDLQRAFNHHRSLEEIELKDDEEPNMSLSCELSFLECMGHAKCVTCFDELGDNDIDWTVISPNIPCSSVLFILGNKFQKCLYMNKDEKERATFCSTFDNCIIQDRDDTEEEEDDENNNNYNPDSNGDIWIDCDKLESCEFEGFKPNYIGDGICHDFVNGCYNHKVCGYDGGDCCPDTCKSKTDYVECGVDGYICKDPKSASCEFCEEDDDKDSKPVSPKAKANCTKSEATLQLLQFGSFGDGWESASDMIITKKDETDISYNGTMHSGYEKEDFLCLSKDPACYNVKIGGGSWGNDISWQIKPMAAGSREIASGGSPMDCEFPVSGGTCENTCNGRANVNVKNDKQYQTFDDLSTCIKDKCIIQQSICKDDHGCLPCMSNAPPAYCLANTNYTALVFCSQCNCVDGSQDPDRKKFCSIKSKKEAEKTDKEKGTSDPRTAECDWEDKKLGLSAIKNYSECSNIKDNDMLTYFKYDNDNFGLLDTFEKCASEYLDNKFAKSALNCMQILHDAIDHPAGTEDHDPKKGELPKQAISQIANDLLHNGHDFCDCSAKAMASCPACKDFMRFKTLLYESVDACNALDKIDCGAWQEFSQPCKQNIENKFKKVDFNKKKICSYVVDEGCGNVGVFPSLRQLDCSDEISGESWKMYEDYKKGCKATAPGPKSKSNTNPVPVPAPTPTPPPPTPKKYVPYPVPKKNESAPTPKKYVSPDDDGVPSTPQNNPVPANGSGSSSNKKYVSPDEKESGKKHHFRNFVLICIVGGGAYWVYKRRQQFDYSRFRMSRARDYAPSSSWFGDGSTSSSGMYDNLSTADYGNGGMSGSTSSFQPVSLPSAPSAYTGGV